MKISKGMIPNNNSNQIQSCSNDSVIDTDKILESASYLQTTFGILSPLHYVYLNIVKNIQIHLIEQLKNNQFDEPFFIACTTANFVQEITNDLQCSSKSNINKLISEFQLRYPNCMEQVISSQMGLQLLYRFMVNYMADLEDELRANAMVNAGQSNFTQNDKENILSALTDVIYQHAQLPVFPRNLLGTCAKRIFEKTIKLGIKYISQKHINKSISISKILITTNDV